MLVKKNNRCYSSNRQYVHGQGFVDSFSSTLRNVGSYISQNKDLLAKPLLGAVGNLGALALTEGGKSVLNHILTKNNRNKLTDKQKNDITQLDPKYMEILQKFVDTSSTNNSSIPTSNVIGSGIKKLYF